MFDDRRRGVGIDRSHPLRPILASSSPTNLRASNTTQQGAFNKRLVGRSNVVERPEFNNNSIKNTSYTHLKNNLSVSNGNINLFQSNFDELDSIDNETFPKEFSSLSLNSTHHVIGSHDTDDLDLKNKNSKAYSSLEDTIIMKRTTGSKMNSIKLNPVITKKSPVTAPAPRTPGRTPTSSSRASTLSKNTSGTLKSPSPKVTLTNTGNKVINTISIFHHANRLHKPAYICTYVHIKLLSVLCMDLFSLQLLFIYSKEGT